MKSIKNIIRVGLIAGIASGIVLSTPPAGNCSGPGNVVSPQIIEAMGELIRDVNTLNTGRKTLPEGNDFAEGIRNRFEIPSRVPVTAPRGGNEIVTLVFNSESLCMVQGEYAEIGPNEYKYLQSLHNLKNVYTLFDKEPLTIGTTVYAFERGPVGQMVVFFNHKGKLRSVSIRSGNSICLKDSPHIIRPLAAGK